MVKNILIVALALASLSIAGVPQKSPAPQQLNVDQFQNGNQLLEFCEDNGETASTNFCLGYISGTADHLRLTRVAVHSTGGTCLPKTSTPRQLTDVFVKYAKNHPEERHKPAQMLVIGAWREAFPCESR